MIKNYSHFLGEKGFIKSYTKPGLKLRLPNEKLFFFFLNQIICCGYSKEPSQWDGSFEHPKHLLKLIGKKIFTILPWNFWFI